MAAKPGPAAAPGPLAPLAEEAARLRLALGGEERARFARYLALLGEWRGRAGLTSLADPEAIQRRHFGESLALLAALRAAGLLAPGETESVVDVGSGAGFPGLPMLILEPALRLTLVEAHRRRARFLETAAAELGLGGVEVVAARAEEAGRDPALRGRFGLAVARAVAPLPVLAEYLLPLLREGGAAAAPKGSAAARELEEAAGAIAALGGRAGEPLALPLPPGRPPQRVLIVRREGPLPDRYPRRPGVPRKRPLR